MSSQGNSASTRQLSTLRRCVLVSLVFPYLQIVAVALMLRTTSPAIDLSPSMALTLAVSVFIATFGALVFMDTMAGRDRYGVRPWMRGMVWCNGAVGIAMLAYALLRLAGAIS